MRVVKKMTFKYHAAHPSLYTLSLKYNSGEKRNLYNTA